MGGGEEHGGSGRETEGEGVGEGDGERREKKTEIKKNEMEIRGEQDRIWE